MDIAGELEKAQVDRLANKNQQVELNGTETVSTSGGNPNTAGNSKNLNDALEAFRTSNSMSKRDLGALLNFVRAISSLGGRIDANDDIYSAIDVMGYDELKVLGTMVGFTSFGLGRNNVDQIRTNMKYVVSKRQVERSLFDVRVAGKSATGLIYENPAMNALKSRLPSSARNVVQQYERFSSLDKALSAE